MLTECILCARYYSTGLVCELINLKDTVSEVGSIVIQLYR